MRGVLAVPGDLNTVTGGYIYDRRVLYELRALGYDISHVELPSRFPDPTPADMDTAFASLDAVADLGPVIIDGLAFGALDPARVRQMQAPIVALIHHPLARENGLSSTRQQALFNTERENLRQAAHVIVPSPHTAAILTSDYGVAAEKISIARPGTDRPKGQAKPAEPPLILSVGIQMLRKGHDVLLQALATIDDLAWQAVIVGAPIDPDYAQTLDDMRGALGLTDRVTLAGQIGDAPLARLYQSATVFALATRFEGYGIVFDEALVHGLPIVSCATGAVPDTVPNGTGYLVAPDAPDAFGQALCDVLSDDVKRGAFAQASGAAGAGLPSWQDTANTFAQTLSLIKQA